MIIFCEYILSVFVTLTANLKVEYVTVQIFLDTQTLFGRKYDFEIGSFNLKAKGDIVSGVLGIHDMNLAVEKYALDSRIFNAELLHKIMIDPEFKSKICVNTTMFEKAITEMPLVNLTTLNNNTVNINILADSFNLDHDVLSETNDSWDDTISDNSKSG